MREVPCDWLKGPDCKRVVASALEPILRFRPNRDPSFGPRPGSIPLTADGEQIPCVFDDRNRIIGWGPEKIEQLPNIVGKCRAAGLLENHRLNAFERRTTTAHQQHCSEARFRFRASAKDPDAVS